MSVTNISVGKNGENVAQAFVRDLGYVIVNTNWRDGRHGEIDIIAYHPDTFMLAFIEVKTRYSSKFGSPLEAVTLEKQNKIRRAAEHYLVACPPTLDVRNIRFDVIGVDKTGTPTHYPNAF